MEDLKALINLLTVQKIKQIEILTEDAVLSEKSKLLYEGIKNQQFKSDQEASEYIYNKDEDYPAYVKLKYRLKQRLLNTLFFIDVQQYSNSNLDKATYRSYRNFALAKIMQRRRLAAQSYSILETTLKTALKYDLVELSMFILKDLKLKYGLFSYNKYRFKKYSDIYNEVKIKFNLIEQAEDLYIKLGHVIANSSSYFYNDEIMTIEKSLEKVEKEASKIDDYSLRFYTYNSMYFLNMIKKDNQKLLDISKDALQYFENKKGFGNFALNSFIQKLGISHLLFSEYEEALKAFNKCLSFKPKPGSITWQYQFNYLFTTYVLNEDYQNAYEVICVIMNHRAFNKLDETYRQPWHLKEAFINFLISIGKIDPEKSEVKKLRTFRLSRFMNEVPKFSADKRGLNITINIIQMLFLIIDKEYDKVLDKLSALKQYNFRYLKRPEYARPSNFIKMLLKIPEGDYKVDVIKRKSQKYRDQLSASPLDFSQQSLNIEIIPYERLWEDLMEMLEK